MTGLESLRFERVRSLHSRFLKAAQKYPKLWHFAARSSLPDVMIELLPLQDSQICFKDIWPTIPADWLPNQLEYHWKGHSELWDIIFDQIAIDITAWSATYHVIKWGGETWIGAFVFEREIENERELEIPVPEVELFGELANDAAEEFIEHLQANSIPTQNWPLTSYDSGPPGTSHGNRFSPYDGRWLSLLYTLFAPAKKEIRPPYPKLTASQLGRDVFTASAKAIEMLLAEMILKDHERLAPSQPNSLDDYPKQLVPRVVLKGQAERPEVDDKAVEVLTVARYNVVDALLRAGPDGLTKDELVRKSGHGSAVNVLKGLANVSKAWKAVVKLPGGTGKRYSLRFK